MYIPNINSFTFIHVIKLHFLSMGLDIIQLLVIFFYSLFLHIKPTEKANLFFGINELLFKLMYNTNSQFFLVTERYYLYILHQDFNLKLCFRDVYPYLLTWYITTGTLYPSQFSRITHLIQLVHNILIYKCLCFSNK